MSLEASAGDSALLADAHRSLAIALLHGGALAESEHHARRAVAIYRAEAVGSEELVAGLNTLVLALEEGGNYSEALATGEEALELAQRTLGANHRGTIAQIENCDPPAGIVSCMVVGSQQRCTRMRSFTGTPVFSNDVMNNVVSCYAAITMGTQLYYRAVADTSAPATRTCHWNVSFGAGFNNKCTIDMADGLPVELMDFEVVEGEGGARSDEDRARDDGTP